VGHSAGKPALAARIAIDTGLAVLDAGGEIFGDVPNIAARAQALAEPGSVVVTARVQRQVAGLFVAEERGSHPLKGVPEPVTLFRLIRASGGGRRAVQRHLTPLVGRDEGIVMLLRRWERAAALPRSANARSPWKFLRWWGNCQVSTAFHHASHSPPYLGILLAVRSD
jgi:Adenylate and Guanylate cyclase catalytic domain